MAKIDGISAAVQSASAGTAWQGGVVPPVREFHHAGRRTWWNAVTYGPFPGGFRPDRCADDFRRIAQAGFNVIRLYSLPEPWQLDLAAANGLGMVAGLAWGQHADFLQRPGLVSAAMVTLDAWLRQCGSHPAVRAVLVGNEIPVDLVRWIGPVAVRGVLERLIDLVRQRCPSLHVGYANFPTTEFLEPEQATFSAFNLYLEDGAALRRYLRRLHQVAGDRPLWISEFGLDSRRHGTWEQADTLAWARRIALEEQCAGFTVFAWSDDWWNRGAAVLDWDFGLTDRQGNDKPALARLADPFERRALEDSQQPAVSIIVCTYRGRQRLRGCLDSLLVQVAAEDEIIVVDDGSEDGSVDWLRSTYPRVQVVAAEHGGLSRARNLGAAAARCAWLVFVDDDCVIPAEWLPALRRRLRAETSAAGATAANWGAFGGPNVAPPASDWREAVLSACPGAASHVLMDDVEAEHLPGCNLAVRADAFWEIGGFDPRFHTAGDDVDFCWRLRRAGHRLGFIPAAALWHHRRSTVRGYLRQQWGYGRAERQLWEKHPEHFTPSGDARWEGCVYGGGPVRALAGSVIYHGPMGLAPYQAVMTHRMPERPLASGHATWRGEIAVAVLTEMATWLRCVARLGVLHGSLRWTTMIWQRWRQAQSATDHDRSQQVREFRFATRELASRDQLLRAWLVDGWQPGPATAVWDLERRGQKLQIAIEHDHLGPCAVLLRVWGTGEERQDFRLGPLQGDECQA